MVPAEATQKSTILRVWKKNDEKHEEFRLLLKCTDLSWNEISVNLFWHFHVKSERQKILRFTRYGVELKSASESKNP